MTILSIQVITGVDIPGLMLHTLLQKVNYFGKNEEFIASVTSGEREKEYILNGEHTSNIPYTVLVVDFIKDNPNRVPNFKLNIGEKTYSGEMELNPFNNTFCKFRA